MKPVLLAALGSATALAFAAIPAQAQDWRGDTAWSSPSRHDGHSFGRRSDGHRDRRSNGILVTDWYAGDWATANNRSWESDSYNDWWHEEPWRAYPHWMLHNEGCARQWYAGDTLRC